MCDIVRQTLSLQNSHCSHVHLGIVYCCWIQGPGQYEDMLVFETEFLYAQLRELVFVSLEEIFTKTTRLRFAFAGIGVV